MVAREFCSFYRETTAPEHMPGIGDCWVWTGSKDKHGYGRYDTYPPGGGHARQAAHRAAWARAFGPIPDGALVCHKCDVPACVRPAHLYLGTDAINAADRASKGRSLRGEASPAHVLTGAQVADMRGKLLAGMSIRKASREFGVSFGCAYSVAKDKTWRNLPGLDELRRRKRAELTEERVLELRSAYDDGLTHPSAVARDYDIDPSHASALLRRKKWKHLLDSDTGGPKLDTMNTPPWGPDKAVVYLRVSSDRQAESGLGVAAQEEACRRYAELRGWTIENVFRDEGMSGSLSPEKRPGAKAALDHVRKTGHVLLVYSLSRFYQQQSDVWRLLGNKKNPVLFVSATEPFDLSTAFGRLVAGTLSAVAQMESDLASERTKAARGAALAAGRPVGGYRRMEDAAPVAVRRAAELAGGGMPQRRIAETLNAEGLASAGGKTWRQQTVAVALRRARAGAANDEARGEFATSDGGVAPAAGVTTVSAAVRPERWIMARAWRAAESVEQAAAAVGLTVGELTAWISEDKALREALRS